MKTRLYPKTSIAIVILASFCVAACQQIPDVEEFLADVSPDEQPNFPLPTSETANCYIVSSSGAYELYTVKGNSTESVGNVSYAEVLWESFGTDVAPSQGDLISSVSYSAGKISYVVASPFKEGNAVIAAKDASGTILWSWHIWLTDQPAEQVYCNNAGTMMDRNLGATSATPGDVGALGLFYQWGRKDPFLGSSSISSDVVAKSTGFWPSAVSSDSYTGTIDYVTSHPMTYITADSSSSHDWHYSSRDNTLWHSVKTMYDPCPVGWRIPDGGDNGVWHLAGFADTNYDSSNKGISFSISLPSTTWYPASGFRNSAEGTLFLIGFWGLYGSVTSWIAPYVYTLQFYDPGHLFELVDYRANGCSIRCLKE